MNEPQAHEDHPDHEQHQDEQPESTAVSLAAHAEHLQVSAAHLSDAVANGDSHEVIAVHAAAVESAAHEVAIAHAAHQEAVNPQGTPVHDEAQAVHAQAAADHAIDLHEAVTAGAPEDVIAAHVQATAASLSHVAPDVVRHISQMPAAAPAKSAAPMIVGILFTLAGAGAAVAHFAFHLF